MFLALNEADLKDALDVYEDMFVEEGHPTVASVDMYVHKDGAAYRVAMGENETDADWNQKAQKNAESFDILKEELMD